MENFKCVDYFQIQWYDPHNFQESLMTTGKIGRHTRNFDIDVKPCMDYVFQVGICTRTFCDGIPGDSFRGLERDKT